MTRRTKMFCNAMAVFFAIAVTALCISMFVVQAAEYAEMVSAKRSQPLAELCGK